MPNLRCGNSVKRARCAGFDPGRTALKVELAGCCPPMGILIDVITGAHQSRQDWQSQFRLDMQV